MENWKIFAIVLVLAIVAVLLFKRPSQDRYVSLAFENLSPETVEEVDTDYLHKFKDEILIVSVPLSGETTHEGFGFGFPYHHWSPGGLYDTDVLDWPTGIFTRRNYWSSGFYTNGWKYALRPGSIGYWPRTTWVRNNGNYYFLNNRQY